MPYPISSFIAPSSEFVALCQSQITLLTKGLKADWSAVYLTEEIVAGEEAHLIPVVVYPQTDSVWQETRLTILPEVWKWMTVNSSLPLTVLPEDLTKGDIDREFSTSELTAFSAIEQQQMVFPLSFEQGVMGLLVTGRKDRQWNQKELGQIQSIARTLAIARLLDQRQGWYQQQLSQQQVLRHLERDRRDNLLHQLRNPLTALRTFSKLLLKRLLPEDSNQSVVKGILRESDRLQELLEEFEQKREIILPETDAVMLSPEIPVSNSPFLLPGNILSLEAVFVKDILEGLLGSAQAIAQEKDIQFIAEVPAALAPVNANAKALQEVLSNLIDNAFKYTPQGGKVTLSVTLDQSNITQPYQVITVADTGSGIPPQDQPKIFTRHYRGVQSQGEIPGTGLGLAIAKELVEQMQGKIELISPNNLTEKGSFTGTAFRVYLPLHNGFS